MENKKKRGSRECAGQGSESVLPDEDDGFDDEEEGAVERVEMARLRSVAARDAELLLDALEVSRDNYTLPHESSKQTSNHVESLS